MNAPLSQDQIIELVRKWADTNSEGILFHKTHIFSIPHIEGLIGYHIAANNAVVLGDPVCAPQDKASLAEAFQRHCEERKLGVVYTIVSEEFTRWAAENLSSSLIEFGQTHIIDPSNNPVNKTGPRAVRLRNKIKQALHAGVTIQEYLGQDSELENQMEQVVVAWVKARRGLQAFFSTPGMFDHRQGKRWFYAENGGIILGVLTLHRLESHQGWLISHVMMTKNAPHGVSELLVTSALQTLAKENCRFVIAGPTPAGELGKVSGLSRLTETVVRWIYKGIIRLLRLNGPRIFWDKFQPTTESSYLLFPQHNLNFTSVKAILKSYNIGLL